MATFEGTIYEIHGDKMVGFLRTPDGARLWFHKHLVAGILWHSLREGHVCRCEEVDRGPDGRRRCRILELLNG